MAMLNLKSALNFIMGAVIHTFIYNSGFLNIIYLILTDLILWLKVTIEVLKPYSQVKVTMAKY